MRSKKPRSAQQYGCNANLADLTYKNRWKTVHQWGLQLLLRDKVLYSLLSLLFLVFLSVFPPVFLSVSLSVSFCSSFCLFSVFLFVTFSIFVSVSLAVFQPVLAWNSIMNFKIPNLSILYVHSDSLVTFFSFGNDKYCFNKRFWCKSGWAWYLEKRCIPAINSHTVK